MVSKTGIHAIKALALLAELPEGEFMGAAAVADRIGAPPNYLGKLLQTLARNRLVVGQKGLNGGFRLARDADTITLLEVVEPIDRISRWNGCFLGSESCDDAAPCPVHSDWAAVRDHYLGFLRNTVLQDIAGR